MTIINHIPTIHVNLTPEGVADAENLTKVMAHVRALGQVPTVEEIAVMPDACPAGQALGTIPVGGVAKTGMMIHPGMHSADVCCSVALSNLGQVDPKAVLDAAASVTHFGAGGRYGGNLVPVPDHILNAFRTNAYLAPLVEDAVHHFATQGDGNHFLYVGTLESTGETILVTHHGSRKPGAMLYKRGMEMAERHVKGLGWDGPMHNAWLDGNTNVGGEYWDALQIIRAWTKESHWSIHHMTAQVAGADITDQFWNEHNFVFHRDGSFFHAKGATPSYDGYSDDDTGRTLIPLNCAEPILIAGHRDAPNGLGFAPHGAGRNFSRKQHMATLEGRTVEQVILDEVGNLDIRAFNGVPDLSELPFAYKPASQVVRQIEKFGLADILDRVLPYGSIMAGEQPWRGKKRNKKLPTQ